MQSSRVRVGGNMNATYAELATLSRHGFIESRHFGSLIALNPAGKPVIEVGPVDAPILPRSSTKPVQALACLRAGAPLKDEQLAIACGSHTGEPQHIAVVDSILTLAGLTRDALQCPVSKPENDGEYRALIKAGKEPERIHMNCSGKHAAMLLACAVNGWPIANYLEPSHPLQKMVSQAYEDLLETKVELATIDGCGAPLFTTTPRGLAKGFRKIAQADLSEAPELFAIRNAMSNFSFYVGGSHHANSDVMAMIPGSIAKGGAEGVLGIAMADGASVAMKIIDGSPRATTYLALQVFKSLGYDISGAATYAHVSVYGGGKEVGQMELGADLKL